MKPTRKAYLVLDSEELNDLVRNKYGGSYDVVKAEGCVDPENICLEFAYVNGEGEELEFFSDDVDQFKLTGDPGILSTFNVLCILCNEGQLPPGDYLVRLLSDA
ncbi:MAG: hypothetical protein AMXMBFR16_11200 [Candidatus Uhrbacteria bacterium]